MIASYPNRTFQLWSYDSSHGMLLVRSPQTDKEETNVDLVFTGVREIMAPRFIQGVELTEDYGGGVLPLTSEHIKDETSRVFVLSSRTGSRSHVIAERCIVGEQEGNPFSPWLATEKSTGWQ